MRVTLKALRCLRKSAPLVIIWTVGFLLCALFFLNESVARKFTNQVRFVNGNSANTGQLFDVNSQLIKRVAREYPIQNRIVESRAGNFLYVPTDRGTVFDSSRGQFGIIDKNLHQKEHGYFVEIGTEGNNSGSLTFLLERKRGWNGLVIEPYTRKFESLMYMKRNSNFLQSCINTTGGPWPSNEPSSEPCLNLQDILKSINRDKIDLLVLDAVGRGNEILKAFPFKDVFVSMISVEVHGTNSLFASTLMDTLRSQFESVQMMVNHVYWKSDVIFLNKNLRL